MNNGISFDLITSGILCKQEFWAALAAARVKLHLIPRLNSLLKIILNYAGYTATSEPDVNSFVFRETNVNQPANTIYMLGAWDRLSAGDAPKS